MHPGPPPPRNPRDTESAPVLGPPPHWPPRIPRTRAPWWMRVRDLVLTIVAWLVCLWILREFVVMGIAWLSPTLGARLKQVIHVTFDLELRPLPGLLAASWCGFPSPACCAGTICDSSPVPRTRCRRCRPKSSSRRRG